MKNLVLKPLAAAVTLALASVSAHAALTAPTQTLTSAPNPTGLYLAVFDSAKNTELVNLSYDESVITAASGALTPNSATSPFVPTTAPAGSGQTGNVLQLNFGQISGFGSLFTSANIGTTSYMVLDGISGAGGTEEFQATSSVPLTIGYGAVNGVIANGIQTEIADWAAAAPTSGDLQDTTGTQTYSAQSGPLKAGALLSGTNYSGSVGSALGFYDVTTTSAHKANVTQYANATGAGYWFLSTSGDLTWNVPVAGTAPVPLPAAFWLLGSGLLGMAGIARRRRLDA